MELAAKIQTRIDELKAAREKLVADANHELELLNVAIGELESLINPPAPEGAEGQPAPAEDIFTETKIKVEK